MAAYIRRLSEAVHTHIVVRGCMRLKIGVPAVAWQAWRYRRGWIATRALVPHQGGGTRALLIYAVIQAAGRYRQTRLRRQVFVIVSNLACCWSVRAGYRWLAAQES